VRAPLSARRAQARRLDLRLSAFCLPFLLREEKSKRRVVDSGEGFSNPRFARHATQAQTRCEDEIARAIRPREAGEWDHWSSRSERSVVEGAPAAKLRCRCKKFFLRTLASKQK
jgi:hypothetical protein